MQHHASGVDHAAQRRCLRSRSDLSTRSSMEGIGRLPAPLRSCSRVSSSARRISFTTSARGKRSSAAGEPRQNFVHGGQVAQRLTIGHAFDGSALVGRTRKGLLSSRGSRNA